MTEPAPTPAPRRRFVAPVVTFAVLAVVALVFHRRLGAWFTGAPGGGATSHATAVTAGAWTIATAVDPDPPGQQGNHLRIEIHDQAGRPVDGARVEVTHDMPAMGAMPEMKGHHDATPAGAGAYEMMLDLPMGGSWTLIVHAVAGNVSATARYGLTVGTRGLTSLGGGATAAGSGSASQSADTIDVDEARQRAIGVRTEAAVTAAMTLEVRAEGKLTYDETRLHDVVLRLGGYISGLRVDETGQTVTKGQPLFQIYSPELYAAEQDYLLARQSRDAMGSAGRGDELVRAGETKLALLGLSPAQIRAIATSGQPVEKITFSAPASGYVIEKNVVEGGAVKAGDRVFRIAALDKVWVEADVYEGDLAHVAKGQTATVTLSYLPGRTYEGKVTFVYPYLDPKARTGRVRIELPNAGLELKPDMFATVMFHVDLGERLQIPVSAILYAGPRKIVMVELGGGRIVPREVTIGSESGGRAEVLSGVAAGERVVTSGNFLIAAESRIRSPGFWEDQDQPEPGLPAGRGK
jgi:RND family efflux transporter MFP subunit